MADNSPLSDPELRHLERRLSELTLPPSRHERERLLYACGQAAGRAQMKRPRPGGNRHRRNLPVRFAGTRFYPADACRLPNSRG